jgi:hypothetical protein
LERSTQSGLPDLRAFERRSRVNPRSVSATHRVALHCARDTNGIKEPSATCGPRNLVPDASKDGRM